MYGAGWFKLLLVGWTFCFFYHLANGVRHLAWDAGYGFDPKRIRASGRIVIVVTFARDGGVLVRRDHLRTRR